VSREPPAVVALVGDLMDRSRITAAVPGAVFARTPTAAAEHGAAVVVVDIARHGGAVAALRAALPDARIVCFGPHVDEGSAAAARAAGATSVLARSRFFHDVSQAVFGGGGRAGEVAAHPP
jgi:hypothetical protein